MIHTDTFSDGFPLQIPLNPSSIRTYKGLITTLPRLGSRVRVSFFAQLKPLQFGGVFLYMARVSEDLKQEKPVLFIIQLLF